jgi:hypothetical protein
MQERELSRRTILDSLIQFKAPLSELKAALAALAWDSDPLVTLARRHVAAVLERFANAGIDAATVEEWANLVEWRDDIQLEPGHQDTIAAAIHDLANPLLQGPLVDLAPRLLSSLR